MLTLESPLLEELKSLPPREKLRLVDALLAELDRPQPELDQAWIKESKRRQAEFERTGAGHSFKEVFGAEL